MSRPAAVVLLTALLVPSFSLGQSSQVVGHPQQETPITNADVVKMVSAGVSDTIIMNAIVAAKNRNFDLGPDALVALKRGGVSDAVISTMQRPGSAAIPAAPSSPPAVDEPDGFSKTRLSGLYYAENPNDASTLRLLSGAEGKLQGPGTGSAVGSYFGGTQKTRAILEGPRASLRVVATPVFYAYGREYLEPTLLKLEAKKKTREVVMARMGAFKVGGVDQDDIVKLNYRRLTEDIHMYVPRAPLPPGEYMFMTASRHIFDFGVGAVK